MGASTPGCSFTLLCLRHVVDGADGREHRFAMPVQLSYFLGNCDALHDNGSVSEVACDGVVVTGPTGSGKTTCLFQYAIHATRQGGSALILCQRLVRGTGASLTRSIEALDRLMPYVWQQEATNPSSCR